MDKLALRKLEREALSEKLLNVNINDCQEAFLGIVHDKQPGTLFYDFEPKNKVGQSIYAELLDKYYEEKGFILSDDVEEVGILSQAQGACSIAVLISKYNIISELSRQDSLNIRDIYEKTIRNILNRIHGDNGSFLFNATPYNITIFDEEYAYIDTMTWVVSAFLNALSINGNDYSFANTEAGKVTISFSDEETNSMLEAVAYCVRYFTECYIDISNNKPNQLSKGWNFTKKCIEPSLYFSYAVSECYLDIYESFQQVIDHHNISQKIERARIDHPEKNDSDDPNAFLMYISPEDRLTFEKIKEGSDYYQKQQRLFSTINGTDGVFYLLEKQIKASAKNVWSLVKDGIDSNFYNYNLSSIIDTRSIENSSSSDALFNNVFIINNIISGGLDEDLKDLIAETDDDEEMSRFQNQYDNLLETLQAALQRTIRYNKVLRSKRKDYIVNDYYINCSENFEGETNRKARDLRKKRIKTFTLSPLLVKTNTLISDYLTKYPQADMIKYLDELIMKKRTIIEDTAESENKKNYYIWIWENGEYLVTSNFYFIQSLSSFYEYVEQYENRFREVDRKNAQFKKEVKMEYDLESRRYGEIFRLSNERDELIQQNDSLQLRVQELESRESEVEAVLRRFVGQEMRKNLLNWLMSSLHDLNTSVLANLDKEDFISAHGKEIAFLDELRSTFAVSYFSQMKHWLQYNGVKGETAAVTLANQLREKWDNDANEEIKNIVNRTDYQQSTKSIIKK